MGRKGKDSFLRGLLPDSRILDVGCGNDSPYFVKSLLPHCHYTGIDVAHARQSKQEFADRYLIASPEGFAAEIAQFSEEFDAVISSHNLEHCNDRAATFSAMMGALRPGGRLYLSFPSEASVALPRRLLGTLNYFDDGTHLDRPPGYQDVLQTLRDGGFAIEYAAPHYRPLDLWLVGLLNEPASRAAGKVMKGTWAYHGFETVIWARKSTSR